MGRGLEPPRENYPPTCGAPCPYGGISSSRKFSSAELGWMGHCNRRVSVEGERCWQHKGAR